MSSRLDVGSKEFGEALSLMSSAGEVVDSARLMGRLAEEAFFNARSAAGLDGFTEGGVEKLLEARQAADNFLAGLDALNALAGKLRAVRGAQKAGATTEKPPCPYCGKTVHGECYSCEGEICKGECLCEN